MTTTSLEEAESPEDTIKVAQPKGSDVEMADPDDEVEEYDFTNEPEDEEQEDDGRDTAYYKNPNGAITIDSDDEDEDASLIWKHKLRPWREPGFNVTHRYGYERMYADMFEVVKHRPLGGDFHTTENAVRQMDQQMARYLQDYAVDEWVIPLEEAKLAKTKLQERERWRGLGIRLFGSHDPPQGHALPFQRSHLPQGYPQAPPAQRPYQPRGSAGNSRPSTQYGAAPIPAGPHAHLISQHPPQQLIPHHLYPQQIHSHAPLPGSMAPPPLRPTPLPITVSAGVQRLISGPTMNSAAQPHEQMSPRGSSQGVGITAPPTFRVSSGARIPPYKPRPRPQERSSNSRWRRNPAEAVEFPWCRQQLDYNAARSVAHWDDSMYDRRTLDEMEATRERNRPIIARYDRAETAGRRDKKQNSGSASEGDQKRKTHAKKTDGVGKQAGASENSVDKDYYSFTTPEDRQRALALGANTPEEVMAKWHLRQATNDDCAAIKVCWNPGKGGRTEELQQASFSIRDHIFTWEQVKRREILTETAALRILDFCPNMASRETLLRLTSEAGLSNMDIRNRICQNGNYVDKATITKRIGSALGQKQQQHVTRQAKNPENAQPTSDKIKGYGPGQDEFFDGNSRDYDDYMFYFGRRITHRALLNHKRKEALSDDTQAGEAADGPPTKRAKTAGISGDSPMSVDTDATEGEEGEEAEGVEKEEVSDDDAVSVQSDTMLDAIED